MPEKLDVVAPVPAKLLPLFAIVSTSRVQLAEPVAHEIPVNVGLPPANSVRMSLLLNHAALEVCLSLG